MLNDVKPPPLDPDRGRPPPASPAVKRGATEPTQKTTREVPAADRAHDLDRKASHGAGIDLVFKEPEDRGDSFNTTLSAVVIGTAVAVVVAIAWIFFH